MINHGHEILRDYRRNRFLGKVKAFLGKVFGKFLVGSSVSIFLVAGFYSANVLLTIH